jgi:AcrR family transcriptional regulator
MGISERKEREREEMRELIFKAARKLFLTKGYEKTSIRNIADAIEYSPATIYLYYQDKNELLYSIHKDAFQKMMAELSKVVAISDPFARLEEMGHQYIKYALENPELYDLMFVMEAPMEALACREELWSEGFASFHFLMQVIEDCIRVGYFKEQNVETTALTIWSFMHGLVTIYLKKRLNMFQDDRELERIQQAYSLFVQMIRTAL